MCACHNLLTSVLVDAQPVFGFAGFRRRFTPTFGKVTRQLTTGAFLLYRSLEGVARWLSFCLERSGCRTAAAPSWLPALSWLDSLVSFSSTTPFLVAISSRRLEDLGSRLAEGLSGFGKASWRRVSLGLITASGLMTASGLITASRLITASGLMARVLLAGQRLVLGSSGPGIESFTTCSLTDVSFGVVVVPRLFLYGRPTPLFRLSWPADFWLRCLCRGSDGDSGSIASSESTPTGSQDTPASSFAETSSYASEAISGLTSLVEPVGSACPVCGVLARKICHECGEKFCHAHVYACAECSTPLCGACMDEHSAEGHWSDSDTAREMVGSVDAASLGSSANSGPDGGAR